MPDVAGLYPKPVAIFTDGKVLRRLEWRLVETAEELIQTTQTFATEAALAAIYCVGLGYLVEFSEQISVSSPPGLSYQITETGDTSYRVT